MTKKIFNSKLEAFFSLFFFVNAVFIGLILVVYFALGKNLPVELYQIFLKFGLGLAIFVGIFAVVSEGSEGY